MLNVITFCAEISLFKLINIIFIFIYTQSLHYRVFLPNYFVCPRLRFVIANVQYDQFIHLGRYSSLVDQSHGVYFFQ
jgi:hypothetical protein